MAYKSMQMKSNDIPLDYNGNPITTYTAVYKNAVVYVDASMSQTKVFSGNPSTYIFIYTYGSQYNGYVKLNNLVDPYDDDGKYKINSSLYPPTTTTLPSGYLSQAQRQAQAQSVSSNSNNLTGYISQEAQKYDYLANREELNVNYNLTNIRSALGIFGIPYQFMPHVDMRMVSSSIDDLYKDRNITNYSDDLVSEADEIGLGYKYMINIYNKMPLLLLTPGKANFLTRYSKEERESLVQQLVSRNMQGISAANTLADIFEKEGRYYEFIADVPTYYQYVNPMCRAASVFMGIGDKTINEDNEIVGSGVPFTKANWEKYTATRLESFQDLGSTGFIGFYIDSPTEIRESFGNQVTDSSLKGMADSISEQGKELNFLFGYGASALDINDTEIQASIEDVANSIAKLTSRNNILNNLTSHLQTVAAGGRIIFPEIWSSSSFDRAYNIDIKLVSPDADKLSIYLNIIVPLMHLIALVAPRTKGKNTGGMNPNTYFQPFLIRAVYKSMFSVDTGIITDMNISKGEEGRWTPDGLPTSVTVSFTIKDLYQIMSISPTENITNGKVAIDSDTYNNTALMDYIGTLCGVNIFEPDLKRAVDMWWTLQIGNKIRDVIEVDIWAGLENNIQNTVANWWRRYAY